MTEREDSLKKHVITGFLWLVVFCGIIYFAAQNTEVFFNILLVLIGFGAVILIHEFGHFIVAKFSDIKVEAFSIGFSPILAGILKTEKGYRIRILPDFFRKDGDEEGLGLLNFTFGKAGKAWETELRIGLIPFGGFVKMLGQEDVGTAKVSDDPRSFTNKSISSRIAVITAGVVFNAISAVLIFMVVFLVGIKLSPPVVGGVIPDSPAAAAGIKAGDEIIEIGGKSDNLDFSNIIIAAALSGKNKAVPIKVRREDGTVEDFEFVPQEVPWSQFRIFGFIQAGSLTVAKVDEEGTLYEKTGLLPKDVIKSVAGKDVRSHWEFEEIVGNTLLPSLSLTAERTDPESKEVQVIETQILLRLAAAEKKDESEFDLSHICSMIPRLQITSVSEDVKFKDGAPRLKEGDVIVAIGDVVNPTFKELRDVTEAHKDNELAIRVVRTDGDGVEEVITSSVVPEKSRGSDMVVIGIDVSLDVEHAVVAKTIDMDDGTKALPIPRGAIIVAVNGVEVSDFYDVIRQIRLSSGELISIDYRVDSEVAGDVALDLRDGGDFISVKASFAEDIPLEPLQRLYKASGPIDAVAMGYRKTVMFMAQTYATLRSLIERVVSPKSLMGPVGIVKASYDIVSKQPFIYYIYFLGLISACIAVFNILPFLPLDGGLIVIMLVEKMKGSRLNPLTLNIMGYASWILIGTLILYVTFNDIVRSIFH